MSQQTHAWTIRAETPADTSLIEALTEAGFGPGRFAKSAYRLREGVAPVAGLGFVAIEAGVLRGAVRFWPIVVNGADALLLGPLAVQADQRGRGIGISLMKHGIKAAKARGFSAILLVGDEPYYSRVGFAKLPPGQVRFPGPVDPQRLLGLSPFALTGAVRRAL